VSEGSSSGLELRERCAGSVRHGSGAKGRAHVGVGHHDSGEGKFAFVMQVRFAESQGRSLLGPQCAYVTKGARITVDPNDKLISRPAAPRHASPGSSCAHRGVSPHNITGERNAPEERHVAQLAGLEDVAEEQGEADEDAQAGDDDVGDPEEGVPAAHPGDGAEDDRLGTRVVDHRVVCPQS
jgi:hypothetical protein